MVNIFRIRCACIPTGIAMQSVLALECFASPHSVHKPGWVAAITGYLIDYKRGFLRT
jgi:hypothetical protein